MPALPPAMLQLRAPFAPLFARRVWCHALVLVAGALRTPGRRTVCAALRAMGRGQTQRWARYHRVLNRAQWSSLAVSRVVLGLLVAAFAPAGPVVVGRDETIARRWGARIAAKGRYRDAVRASKHDVVNVRGRRWLCLLLLVPRPWAGCCWAWPFRTIRAPAARHDHRRGRRHKTLSDGARQALLRRRRGLPGRALVVVADSGYAASALLARCARLANPSAVVTRRRRDAARYEPAPPRRTGQTGRPRTQGKRLPTRAARLAAPATAWTPVVVATWYGEGARTVEVAADTAVWSHTGLPPVPIRWVLVRAPQGQSRRRRGGAPTRRRTRRRLRAWFVRRWRLEVTFAEARRHRGVARQRQWSDRAILRTTPALCGLFALVTLYARPRRGPTGDLVRQAAWYHKPRPTFSDALALVRREFWGQVAFGMSVGGADLVKVPRALVERFTDALCYAA